MMRTLRILGKRGRITVPYEIRKKLGFQPNDVLSFQIMDDRTVSIQRERLCNSTRGRQRMKENLRILMVEPQKAPYEASIPHELSAMQQAVGGLIEVVRNGDGTLIVCNEEGKLLGMEGNRRIPGDVLAGPFFVVGDAGETFRSLTEEELERYRERFAEVEDISPQEVQAATGFFFYAM